MTRPSPVTAAPCVVGNAACPGAHACLYLRAGVWRSCGAVVLDEEQGIAPSDRRFARNGQELAA